VRSAGALLSRGFGSALPFLGLARLLLALPAIGWGQTVSLQVQAIYAANQTGGVDSRLGNLAENLQKTFPYSMYQLLDAPKGWAELKQA